LFFAAIAGQPFDLVSKTAVSLVNGASIAAGTLGQEFATDGLTKRVDFANATPAFPGAYSYGSIFKMTAANAALNNYLIAAFADATNLHFIAVNNGFIALGWGAGGAPSRQGTFTPTLGKYYTVSGSTPPVGSTLKSLAGIYIDGLALPDTGAGADGTMYSNAAATLSLSGRATDNLRNLNGGQALAVVWGRTLTPEEHASFGMNPWQLFAPLSRQIPVVSGTISHPGSDVSVAGWTFNGASLSASIGETTRDDAFYAEAAYGVSGAITALTLPLAAGTYVVTFAGEYLTATAASGQFRFTALDSSNASLGVSSWQAVTSAYAQYDVPITVTGGTATRLKIEIQA
jgi:hypothetical protein